VPKADAVNVTGVFAQTVSVGVDRVRLTPLFTTGIVVTVKLRDGPEPQRLIGVTVIVPPLVPTIVLSVLVVPAALHEAG
jgi:hypothetical protein